VRASHVAAATFDDPNLVSCAGLVPVLELAQRAGLHDLVEEHVHLSRPGGCNAHLKVPALVAGMVAGADCIDDMDLLRHGALPRLLPGGRAPSTLGTFLRSFTFGHVRQLDAVASRLLTSLASWAPLLPGDGQIRYVDIDDTIKQTYGYAKQGAAVGYTGVRGLDALITTVSTASSAPLVTAARLRKGSTAGVKGAWRLLADTLRTVQRLPGSGPVVVRADSAFYSQQIFDTCRRHNAHFSITAPLNSSIRQAITTIPADAWTTIQYTNAIYDEQAQRWVSTAEVAEIGYTVFAYSKRKAISARLLVRRVPDLNPANQNELFTVYRYHAVFTDSPLPTIEAEAAHRAHAIVEQVIADLKNSALAHLPSGNFWANSAWLVLATIAFNLTRAAGALAGAVHAKATTGTLRAHLITVPARLARSGRQLVLHLPSAWPWQNAWTALFTAARHGPRAFART
jgi:hypothetical protein